MVMVRRFAILASIALASPLADAQTPSWRHTPGVENGPGVTLYGGLVHAAPRGETVLLDGREMWAWDGRSWAREQPAPTGYASYGYGTLLAYDEGRDRIVHYGTVAGKVWEHDGAGWSQGVQAPLAARGRSYAAMVYDAGRARTVLFGGESGTYFDETWEYDGITWAQGVAAPPALTGRSHHAMVYDSGRGRIVLFGGENASGELDETWEHDGTAWVPAPDGPFAASEHHLAYDAARGVTVLMVTEPEGPSVVFQLWDYDGSSWSAGPVPPASFDDRFDVALGYDATRGRLIVHGGLGRDGQARRETWEVDAARQWTLAHADVDTAAERYLPFLAYDIARDRVVAVSGGPWQDVREYDGEAWVPGVPMPAPLRGRFFPAFIYDSVRSRSVLFGGHESAWDTGTVHDDTWYYDGLAWTLGPTAPAGLAPRGCHMMSFDSARGVTVLFGGDGGAPNSLDDTWELDGTGWTQGPPPPLGLAAREYHVMAFDERRAVTVMWGGDDSNGGEHSDTWEYDGVAWSPGAPTPAAMRWRFGQGFAYDPLRGRIMMSGGDTLSRITEETWLYDGTAWIPGDPLPSPKGPSSMVWDSARSRMFLWGGGDFAYDRSIMTYCNGCTGGEQSAAGAGSNAANEPRLRLFDERGILGTVDVFAYGAGGFGLHVGAGDVDGAGSDEVLTGPGPGAVYGPQVRAFRNDGTAVAKVNFYAYGTLKFGVKAKDVALDGDAPREILSGAGPGDVFGTHVRAWNYDGIALAPVSRVNFFAYSTLKYGVNPAAGDLDASGDGEILTGPGPGAIFAPQVRGFDFDGTSVSAMGKVNFAAFPAPQYGTGVASSSIDGDPFSEIVATPGPGSSSAFPARVRAFDYDGASVTPKPGHDVLAFPTLYGATAGPADLDGDGRAEILAGPGPDPTADASIVPHGAIAGQLVPLEGRYRTYGLASHGAEATGGSFGM